MMEHSESVVLGVLKHNAALHWSHSHDVLFGGSRFSRLQRGDDMLRIVEDGIILYRPVQKDLLGSGLQTVVVAIHQAPMRIRVTLTSVDALRVIRIDKGGAEGTIGAF